MDDRRTWSGIHIVCGFSAAGKSDYLRHLLENSERFFQAKPAYERMFHKNARNKLAPGEVFHLDISGDRKVGETNYAPDINSHFMAAKGIFSDGISSVDFLILPESILRERLEIRTTFSNDFDFTPPDIPYPRARKLEVLDACPLADRYAMWFDYFDNRNTQVRYIHSGNRRYDQITDRQAALKILSNRDYSLRPMVHESITKSGQGFA